MMVKVAGEAPENRAVNRDGEEVGFGAEKTTYEE